MNDKFQHPNRVPSPAASETPDPAPSPAASHTPDLDTFDAGAGPPGHSGDTLEGSRRTRRYTAPIALTVLAAALLVIGIAPRLHASAALNSQTEAQRALTVSVIAPSAAPAQQELILPGSVMPFADASIYARTSGYIEHWGTDIGTHVKAGQQLAQIAAPDLDAQLRQARADESA